VTTAAITREQRQQARDFAENVRLLQAAVAPAPELLDLLKTMQGQIADQARMLAAQEVRIAALEARPADDEDGQPRPRGKWLRMKDAVRKTGYSESGLRRLCRLGQCVADCSAPHLLVNINSVPRRSVKVSKV
jgi:hypothetical protein